MSAPIREAFERQRSAGTRAGLLSLNAFISTVSDYKADGTGAGLVWVNAPHADDPNQQLGPMPIMVPWAGSNFGELGGPANGTPVIVLNLAPDNDDYVAIGFLHSKVRPAPKVPSGEKWQVHPNGGVVKLTNDGGTPGDGQGGTQVGGGAQHKTFSKAGHLDTFLDGVAAAITRQASDGTSKTIHDAIAHETSHLGSNVTLGARLSSMSAVNAAINKAHVSNYDANLQTAKITDYIANANLYHAAGAVTSGQLTIILASLVAGFTVGTSLSGVGSSAVKLVT